MATATATYNATPPTLASCNNNYKQWKKLIKHWQKLSMLDQKQRASAIIITLSSKALNAALQIPEDSLEKEDGVDTLMQRLDSIYLKDELSEKFRALEAFQSYRRPSTLAISDFLIEFENKHFKIKEFGATISNDMLGFRLIKAANLAPDKEELIKATVSDLTYDIVKAKMNKIFSDESKVPSNPQESVQIQQETFHASEQQYDSSEGPSNSDEEEVYYANKWRQNPRKKVSFPNSRRSYQHRSSYGRDQYRPSPDRDQHRPSSEKGSILKNWRNPDNQDNRPTKHGKNSVDQYGNQTRCSICESINHWANNCPDREKDSNTYIVHELVLHANSECPVQMDTLLAETWRAGLVDCGASRTVTGTKWADDYVDSLPSHDQSSVSYSSSNSIYRFGDGQRVQAQRSITFPAYIGPKRIFITSDIIDKDIPLLLSKRFLKKGKMKLDFDRDILQCNGESIPLTTIYSGHYILPLTKAAQVIYHLQKADEVILTLSQALSDTEIALKLHRQFAHATKEALTKLVKLAGQPWNSNKNLFQEIENVVESCGTCQKYKKAPPRPVVGLPMATQFLETVALDIKFYGSKPILYLIDLCTRLFAAAVMPNK